MINLSNYDKIRDGHEIKHQFVKRLVRDFEGIGLVINKNPFVK